MWQLPIICIVFSVIYAREVTNKIGGMQIVGGHNIDIKDAPFQVSVLFDYVHTCGGSIIAKDIILTTCKCTVHRSPTINRFKIRVGSSLHDSGGSVFSLAKIKCHPFFNFTTNDYDVAILKLKNPLEFSDKVKPIDMVNYEEEIADGAMMNVTGWGPTNDTEPQPPSKTLQQVTVQKVNQEDCRVDYPPDRFNPRRVTQRMLCAGVLDGGKGPCGSDRGGPLVHNGKLAGLVSWGYEICDKATYPRVYTKVSVFRIWIDHNMKHLTGLHESVN